jgi:PAS domain S-box-containing protein
MLKNLKLRGKILIMLLSIALITACIMGTISFIIGKNDLKKESFKKLTAIREMKANQIENYFQQIFDQVNSFSENRMVIDAVKDFKKGFDNVEDEVNYSELELEGIDSVLYSYYHSQYLNQLFYRDSTLNYFSIPKNELLKNQEIWLAKTVNDNTITDSLINFPKISPADFKGNLKMGGSSTTSSLVEHMVNLFKEEGAQGDITYQSTSTLDGIKSLIEESGIDLAGISHELKEQEIELFSKSNLNPLSFRIGTDAIVVVAGNGNTFLSSLSSEELRLAFTTARLWSDINPKWPNEIIKRFIPTEGSGSYTVFMDVILNGNKEALQNVPNTTFIKDGQYMNEQMKSDPNTIAFFSYNYYDPESLLKIIDVDGIELTDGNVSNGSYPLTRPLFIITTERKLKANKNIAIVLNYFLNAIDHEVGTNLTEIQYWPKHNNSRVLQSQYIADNPYQKGEKDNLVDLPETTSYNVAHKLFHPIFKNYLDRFGYYDVFVIDADGNIVYSVKKEMDFATNLMYGPYSKTNLSQVFKQAIKSNNPTFISFEDFKPYLPSYNAPASFIASPIFDGNQRIGVLAFQLPVSKINNIMTDGYQWEEVGLGYSGETYLVGKDYLMRNQSRFLIEDAEKYFMSLEKMNLQQKIISKIKVLNSSIGLQPVRTPGTIAALNGETGTKIFHDYRGVEVLSAYKPLKIDLVDWVIMSEIDKSEAYKAIPVLIKNFLYWSIALFSIILLLAIYFSRSISKPIQVLSERASDLAEGNLNNSLIIKQNDEIGLLAGNFEKMRISIKKLIGDLHDINQNLENRISQRTEELTTANKQIQAIVDSLADALIIINELGIIVSFSPSAEKMFQYKKEEIIGRNIQDLIPSPHKEVHNGYLENYKRTGKRKIIGFDREVNGLRKDGSIFPASLKVSEVKTEKNKLFVGLMSDLTNQKKSELRLKSQSAALKSAANGVVITNISGEIVWVNPAFSNLTGYSWREVIGKTPRIVNSGQQDESFFKNMWDTILAGEIWQGEIINKKKNGSLFYEEMTITPIINDKGEIDQFVAIKNNISERKKAEERIKASERKFRSIAATATDAIISANSEGKIESWNTAAETIFGYTKEEAIGEKLEMIIPKEHHKGHQTGMNRVLSGGKKHAIGKTVELEGRTKTAKIIPIELSLSSWKSEEGMQFSGIIRDITDRKKMEEILIKANKRMSGELNVAKEIQMSMLPLIFPAFPKRNEIDIYANLIPAREVGGDFYDFHFLDDNHIYFVVGDVSGKGVPAALMMAVTKTLLKSTAGNDKSTASILTHVNNEIAKDNDAYMFITIFIAILNTTTGEMVYSNAGHNPSFIIKSKREMIKLGDLHGPVVGAMEDMTYAETKVIIDKNDIIFAYTDGITEAQNPKEELYSDPRLFDLLKNGEYKDPTTLINLVEESVFEFQGNAEQFDDITALSLQYLGDKEYVMTKAFSVTIENQLNQMPQVIESFEAFGEKNELSFGVIQKFNIALDELLNNIISYGFQDDLEHEILVEVELRNERLIITLTDDGIPFNPFQNNPPDTKLSIDERNIGGLGIYIVKNLVDEYGYNRHADKNIITLVKYNINK